MPFRWRWWWFVDCLSRAEASQGVLSGSEHAASMVCSAHGVFTCCVLVRILMSTPLPLPPPLRTQVLPIIEAYGKNERKGLIGLLQVLGNFLVLGVVFLSSFLVR